MPCYTKVTVKVKDLLEAKATMKAFGLKDHEWSYIDRKGEFEITLPIYTPESRFKTEYGMRVAEKNARKFYGSRVRTFRSVEDGKQTLNIKIL